MGLFEFVFGKGAPKDDTQSKQAYYLSDDDAKTFGNIDYMRSVKTVRRTFAKKKGAEHMESVKQISAMKATSVEGNSSYSPSQAGSSSSSSSNSSATPAAIPTTPRRTAASSNDMDMFRNMAKKMRK